MNKYLLPLIFLFSSPAFPKKDSTIKTYIAQVDADKGIQVSVLVNGIPVEERDGSDWISGGSQINPYFRKGKNEIEIKSSALPSLSQEPRLRVLIQTREEGPALYSLDHMTDKIKLPISKTIQIDLPDFPQTDLWLAESPGDKLENQIVDFLKSLRGQLILMAEKKDFKGLIKTLEVSNRIYSLALDMDFSAEMMENHLKEILGTGPNKILHPPEISIDAINIVNLGSNLYKVSRKDQTPLLLIKTDKKESRLNYGVFSPILGKIKGKWEIVMK
jgi:hypothetical protein